MAPAQRSATAGFGDPCSALIISGQLRRVGAGPDPEAETPARAGTIALGARLALALLGGYKRFVSPLLPNACRFSPSCSEYARLAILKYGVLGGSWRAAGRVLRCHPFHPGGVDLP